METNPHNKEERMKDTRFLINQNQYRIGNCVERCMKSIIIIKDAIRKQGGKLAGRWLLK